MRLRRYQADNIADFLEHRGEISGSSYFSIFGPFNAGNPFDVGTNRNLALVTLGTCLYEKTLEANEDLDNPVMRKFAQYSTFWAYISDDEKPCFDITPNAELSDRTGTLKVISGSDIPSGRSIYSPILVYNIKSNVTQLLNGFFIRGGGKKRKKRYERRKLELATQWI